MGISRSKIPKYPVSTVPIAQMYISGFGSHSSEKDLLVTALREFLLLFTVPPLPSCPDFGVPFFFRRIALSTLLLAAFPYFLVPELERLGIYLLQIRI